MAKIYRAIEGERLDEIVFNFYGNLELFEQTLENNPHLISTVHLKAGDEVTLEEIVSTIKTQTEENVKSLW